MNHNMYNPFNRFCFRPLCFEILRWRNYNPSWSIWRMLIVALKSLQLHVSIQYFQLISHIHASSGFLLFCSRRLHSLCRKVETPLSDLVWIHTNVESQGYFLSWWWISLFSSSLQQNLNNVILSINHIFKTFLKFARVVGLICNSCAFCRIVL